MSNKSLLIKNGFIVNSSGILKSDIFISNGKIIATGTPSDLITKFGGDCTLTIKTTSDISSFFKDE